MSKSNLRVNVSKSEDRHSKAVDHKQYQLLSASVNNKQAVAFRYHSNALFWKNQDITTTTLRERFSSQIFVSTLGQHPETVQQNRCEAASGSQITQTTQSFCFGQ